MSRSEDFYQAERWLDTAEEDRRAAQTLLDAGHNAHVCFAVQQCGEKAVKAIWYALGEDPWGHSIQKLVMRRSSQNQVTVKLSSGHLEVIMTARLTAMPLITVFSI
jgi:HEPN domain-containing protein